MQQKITSKGFTPITVLLAILTLVIIAVGGWYVWRKNHTPASKPDSQTSRKTNTRQTPAPADPYMSWKTTCDTELKACYKYPSDWVAAQYVGIENTAETAYVRYQNPDNKDQAVDSAYIVSIDDLATPNQGLKVVGYVIENRPGYIVYDASIVAADNLTIGQTTELVTGNPTFSGKSGHESVTFVATPNTNGQTAITTQEQAKTWFSTPEAKECLKILQSFHYQ